MTMLRLDDISSQHSINIRERLDKAVVEHYMEVFDLLPPIVVFGSENFLGDGFHRVAAAERLKREVIAADRQPGTRKDAEDYAVTANAQRGIPLKKAERDAGIKRLLAHGWTQQRIADAMGISQQSITNIGNALALRGEQPKKAIAPGEGHRPAKQVKPLPPEVAAELTDAHLRPIASLPVEAMEPVAIAVVKGDLTERETHAVVTTVKADGLDAGLAVAADLAIRRKIKKGMEAVVAGDALIAVLDAYGALLTVQKFTPEEAARSVENGLRDHYASEFTKFADWATAFSEALTDRRLKAL